MKRKVINPIIIWSRGHLKKKHLSVVTSSFNFWLRDLDKSIYIYTFIYICINIYIHTHLETGRWPKSDTWRFWRKSFLTSLGDTAISHKLYSEKSEEVKNQTHRILMLVILRFCWSEKTSIDFYLDLHLRKNQCLFIIISVSYIHLQVIIFFCFKVILSSEKKLTNYHLRLYAYYN